ncbi:MAG: hypothetical protein HC874_23565 [Richelia sp. SL_2_1]|nr:hypothetical protein [Richelia sp. SL_2_1]
MRLSITSKANQKFIRDLAKRWNMTDKEALQYLLNQTRLNGFSNTFHNKDFDTSELPEVQPPQSFYQELASEEFVSDDPLISRLIASGLESF